ncbi:hypothetical protein ACFX5D_02385 [Flavobacterium sp. LB3P45]|uniref:Uncharacterized protein n=1 Tax=Flavobacterium fructosi TaxID=3230416 RepID=A0ABW6HIZ8_9FLAO
MENNNKGNLGQENRDNQNPQKKANFETSDSENTSNQMKGQSNPQMEQDSKDISAHDQVRNPTNENIIEEFKSSTSAISDWKKDLYNQEESKSASQTDQIFNENQEQRSNEEQNKDPQSVSNVEENTSENDLDSPQNDSNNNFKRANVNDEEDSEIEDQNKCPKNFL